VALLRVWQYEKIASDRLVVWIAALNPGLEVLSLKGCTQVSDVGLTAALGRCTSPPLAVLRENTRKLEKANDLQ
jgi:hypothetical protein